MLKLNLVICISLLRVKILLTELNVSFSFEFWPELWTFVRGLTVCAGFGFEADVDDSGAVGDDFTLVALVVRDADALARMRRRDRRRSFRSFAEDLSHHFRIDGRFCRKSQIFFC